MGMRGSGTLTLAAILIVELGALPRSAAAQSAAPANDVRIDPNAAPSPYPTAPPPSAYPNGSPPSWYPTAPPPLTAIRLHVEASVPVVVERRLETDEFSVVCTAPCDTSVPADGQYRVTGEGIRPTNAFALTAGTPAERITVTPKSQSAFVAGAALTAAGAGGLFVGWIWLFTSSLADAAGEGDRSIEGSLVTLAVSGVALAGGLVLLLTNRHSSAVQLPMSGAAQAAPLTAPAPTWRTAERDLRAPSSTVGMPLLHLSF